MKRLILVIVVIWAHTALAQTPHEVQQILDINNNVPDMLYRFEPDYLSIATGETVRFLGTVRGQTVHSVRDMLPDGADKIAIMPRDNPDVTFTVPGVYGIRCMKHARHGMVTLIVVGNDYPNLAAVRAAVPKGLNWFAHPKMYRLLDRAEADRVQAQAQRGAQ